MIVFNQEHVAPILAGQKTVTRRIWPRCRVRVGGTYACAVGRFSKPFARGAALRNLVVQELGIACRSPAFRYRAHCDEPVVGPEPHTESVTYLHRFGRLGAIAVELDFAAGDRFSSKAARLEETRGPEPTIEANRV